MSELPKGWMKTTLGKIVDYGRTEKANIGDISNDTWVLELEDIEKNSSKLLNKISFSERQPKSSKNLFKAGDVLYGKLRPYLNKVIIASEDGICTSEIVPLRAEKGLVEGRFLFYWLKGIEFRNYVNAVSYGVNMPRLGTKDGKQAPFVLAPLAEQKRIVEKLDQALAQVDTIKARLDGIPAILKRFRQSVLAAAVSGKLTEKWREENKTAKVNFNEIKLIKENLINNKAIKKDLVAKKGHLSYSAPKEWLCVKLSSVALKITDGEHKTPKREESGHYLLSARNVRDGYIALDNVDYVGNDEFLKLRKRCDPNKGDILISCSGSVGRVCLVDEDDKYVMVRSAALVRGIDEIIFNKYLMLALQSPLLQKNIEDSSRSTAQSNLFLGPIKELDIPLPSITEQTEIVRLVDQYFAFANTIEAQVQKAQQRVDKLTQSILAKAFRGELVPQDPSDEPADELLKRIATARAEAEALAKAAKKAGKKTTGRAAKTLQ
ncbi:restriction endonuclease subunit S [Marinomonas fungiae]|uniref:Restriction endonuclease S subunit n=1 Tax=Marinomonas fungiae TaxID=1137284 RepID=A0A0K6IGL0_9GAMM|nr:restriction endonuclease subunit S [Marinomonas fungiae]CUB02270.1 Restriction endonuclease S subunit [Marinomonas fungiae]